MGHLFIDNDSFELQNVQQNKRDKLLINFCKALDLAINDKDSLYSTADIYSRDFSYGKLFYGLLLNNVSEVNRHASLQGISDIALSLFQSIAFSTPNMVEIVESLEEFDAEHKALHFGHSGFDYPQKTSPYVGCNKCWINWKIKWLSSHNNEINWQGNIDINGFLPNKNISDKIIAEEIEKHGMTDKRVKHGNNDAITFHREVMAKKGHSLAAYTIEVGTKIAETNYYTLDSKLTAAEEKAAGHSFRTIFKITGHDNLDKYISLDHRHGMFEFHNHKGEHIGEFKFDGSFNSGADVTHNFKTL